MYYQHTRGVATTRHRGLVERGGREAFVRDKFLNTHKKGGRKQKKNVRKLESLTFTNLKKHSST